MTTAAEENLAAALAASKIINQEQQHLTDESRVLLAALLRDEMRIAVAEGVAAVLTSEEMWAKVFIVLQKQALQRTGRFFFDGFMNIAGKAIWLAVGAGVVYAIGGWALLKMVWAAVAKGNTPP